MSSFSEVPDVCTLSDITEEMLLEYLNQRYEEDIIYSFVGDILVSINPYKPLHSNEEKPPSYSMPHTCTVARRMYSTLMSTATDQCCIISGESGAGKTEICKLLVRHLTELSMSQSSLELRIIQMNPLLEGFGNAQTTANNNSSRFGKYLQLKFSQPRGRVTGAKVNEYLLEKSRVVYQNPGERNFHIFYWMLGGLEPSLKMELHIEDPHDFRYLGEMVQFHGDEADKFKKLKESLDLVGFEEEEQDNIFVIIAAILHLGNISIDEDQNEFAYIPLHDLSTSLELAASLLGVSNIALSQLLTVTISTAKNEVIHKHLSKRKAEATRDAISKALYDRLFRWVVSQINHLLAPSLEEIAWGNDIGILDIFGFENFKGNSFEQLCINLANEQLHNFFIQHIFYLELDQYQEEGINGVHIDIPDSQHLLDSFLLGSQSVFYLLDDQGLVPRATDITFLQKLNQRLKKQQFYTEPKTVTSGRFAIHHYAGEVLYSVEGFLEKNMDSLPAGVKRILDTSNNSLVSLLFRASINPTGTLSLHRTTTSRLSTKRQEQKGRKGKSMATPTISSQFKSSLTVLMTKMSMATPHFICCLKPNALKRPSFFDQKFIHCQLQHTGMMATIQLRREGYAYRPSYQEFYERFGCLLACDITSTSLVKVCQLILSNVGINLTEYQIGHSKLFLRHNHLEMLDRQVELCQIAASKLQSVALGFIHKRRYQRLLGAQEAHRLSLRKLLQQIQSDQLRITNRLERLNNQDEKRHGEREDMILQETFFLPKLSPPSDLHELPPPLLLLSDDEDNSEKKDSLRRRSSRLKMDNHMFVAVELRRPLQHCNQQAKMLRSSVSSSHSWLHGMISQKKAEDMLRDRLPGTFLVRINRKKLSHILCYKSSDGDIYHLPISQLPNGKYVLIGDTAVHSSIDDLVDYYSETPLKGTVDCLLFPYSEEMPGLDHDEDVRIEMKDKVAVV